VTAIFKVVNSHQFLIVSYTESKTLRCFNVPFCSFYVMKLFVKTTFFLVQLVLKISALSKLSKSSCACFLTGTRQNHNQKVFDKGAFTFVQGAWHCKIDKTPLIYIVSYSNLGSLEHCLGGLAHQSPAVGRVWNEVISAVSDKVFV